MNRGNLNWALSGLLFAFGLVFAVVPDGVLYVLAYAWFFLPFDLGPGKPGSARDRKAP